MIYSDKEESFNINFSSEGNYFGRGIYFAAQAPYSHNYSYPSGSNRQMLYCKVMVGHSQIMLHKDRSNNIKDTKIRDEKKQIKY